MKHAFSINGYIRRFVISLLFFILPSQLLAAENSAPNVIVTIKPIHSLVSGIMHGIGTPKLLLKGASSPHHFQLNPSDAFAIKKANLIVRVGPTLETPLNKILSSLSDSSATMNVIDIKNLKLFKIRSPHAHDHHAEKTDDHHADDHEKHSDHDHEKDHSKDHSKDHGKDHGKDHDEHAHDYEKEEHDSAAIDPHIWLNTDNAKEIVLAIVKKLSLFDPNNSSHYKQNAVKIVSRLQKLDLHITGKLKLLHDRSYMVFHDAYRYMTDQHKLKYSGAITLNPSTPPSAKHLKELSHKIDDEKVVCIFSEPQYNSKIISSLVEGHNVRLASLDAIGIKLPTGEDAYFMMMKQLAENMHSCLKP